MLHTLVVFRLKVHARILVCIVVVVLFVVREARRGRARPRLGLQLGFLLILCFVPLLLLEQQVSCFATPLNHALDLDKDFVARPVGRDSRKIVEKGTHLLDLVPKALHLFLNDAHLVLRAHHAPPCHDTTTGWIILAVVKRRRFGIPEPSDNAVEDLGLRYAQKDKGVGNIPSADHCLCLLDGARKPIHDPALLGTVGLLEPAQHELGDEVVGYEPALLDRLARTLASRRL